MDRYSLIHLGDDVLLRNLATLVRRDRATTASLLAHLAEVDARKLYLPAAYPSIFEYCLHELGLSEDAAYRRITAARSARQFPGIFEMIADGRLYLTAVLLLAPFLTDRNADELLAAAAHKTKSEIEQLIAERFPRSEMLPLVSAIAGARDGEVAPGRAQGYAPEHVSDASCQLAPARVGTTAESRVAPIASQRFELRFTVGQDAYDLLCYAQELLSHQVEPGNLGAIFERSLEALIATLEKRKFAATGRPRQKCRPTASRRHVPAHVKRAVWQRDGGRCTFVSDTGHRCQSRTRLEFDHVEAVARGGEATVDGIRLRCRAHNQYTAECAFGVEFMEDKRQEARQTAAERRDAAVEAARRRAAQSEVVPWLRQLGFRAEEARRAAALCESIPGAPLEERVRVALRGSHAKVRSGPGW